MLSSLMPERIDDIIAAIALYRPGPMDSIPKFVECRHHPEKVTYATPQLEPILRSTYGCVVYQEQVMQIFRQIGGYTFGHADIVRRAMSKKKASVLLAERETFVNGALERGIDREVAEQLFADMESFANYAFNKSHAAAYAVISYRTAYLKQHYPREYLSALLTSVLGNQTKVAEYIAECASRGISVLPPDINESRMVFAVSGKHIRFGLLAIKNVGRQFLAQILNERRSGPFASFEDFINRMGGGDLNKRMVEALIKAGAFDRLGVYRSQLLSVYERLIDQAAEKGRNNLEGQLNMFAMPEMGAAETTSYVSYPDIPELTAREKLMMEREATGMFFSGQLLDSYSKHLATITVQSVASFTDEEADPADRAPVTVAGMITSVTVKNTKNGERMAFFNLEDQTGEVECVVFAKKFEQVSHVIRADLAVCVSGNISVREDERPKILLNKIEELVENQFFRESEIKKDPPASEPIKRDAAPAAVPQSPKKLFLRLPDRQDVLWKKALNLVEIFEGDFPVAFYDASEKQYDFQIPSVNLSHYVLEELRCLLGDENVILK